MKRLTTENINTPEYFDKIWATPGTARYDPIYAEAFIRELPESGVVADVGCGLYGWLQYSVIKNPSKSLIYFFLDYSGYVMSVLRDWIQHDNALFYNVDITKCPEGYPGAYTEVFDFVGSSEVIEHLEDPQGFVDKLFLMTKPGGKVMIGTLDTACPDAIKHGPYPEHLYSFESQDLIEMFNKHSDQVTYRPVGNYMCCVGIKRAPY